MGREGLLFLGVFIVYCGEVGIGGIVFFLGYYREYIFRGRGFFIVIWLVGFEVVLEFGYSVGLRLGFGFYGGFGFCYRVFSVFGSSSDGGFCISLWVGLLWCDLGGFERSVRRRSFG